MTAAFIVLLLIAINGLFVVAEFALVGAPRATIECLAAAGHPVARQVGAILRDPRAQDRYFATAQVGITLASLGLGMYGEHVLAQWLVDKLTLIGFGRWFTAHTLASLLAVTVLTYFHIVLGEMVPKSIALQKAERAALWVMPSLIWTERLLYPLVAGLNLLARGILRLVGIRRQIASGHYHTPEELADLVRQSERSGLLGAETGQVVRELFNFGELSAHEVMVPRVRIRGIPLDASPEQVRACLRASGFTRYPVYERDLDHIAGMVHIKDLLHLVLRDGRLTAEALRPVPYVPETAELDTVLGVMRRENTQMVIVMDEFGGTAGLITIEDLFEEVVGDIEEGEGLPPGIHRHRSGRLRVKGTVRLDELAEALGIEFELEEVETVSGLILALLERPALVGDIVTYGPLRFQVTAVDGRGVRECVVLSLTQPPSPS